MKLPCPIHRQSIIKEERRQGLLNFVWPEVYNLAFKARLSFLRNSLRPPQTRSYISGGTHLGNDILSISFGASVRALFTVTK